MGYVCDLLLILNVCFLSVCYELQWAVLSAYVTLLAKLTHCTILLAS